MPISQRWGDGEHEFRLAIGQFRELQDKVNRARVQIGASPIGPRTLLALLNDGDAWPDEVSEVLRLGLIGAGMSPPEASLLVKRYGPPERPILESSKVAYLILLGGMVGVPDDPVGKKRRRGKTRTRSSASPNSTEAARQSDTPPDKSTNLPSGNSQPASTASTAPTEPKSSRPHQAQPNSTISSLVTPQS